MQKMKSSLQDQTLKVCLRTGNVGFGNSGKWGKAGSSVGISSFGNSGNSGFGSVGSSGLGKVGTSGNGGKSTLGRDGSSGNSGLGSSGTFGNVVSKSCRASAEIDRAMSESIMMREGERRLAIIWRQDQLQPAAK
uniref:Uncharacterized protein n=1 Tax=Manihot esculenta TaxID=3983 RepID=A0A2C9VIC8_MANES